MLVKRSEKFFVVLMMTVISILGYGQGTVPLGIYYQAVARDNVGKELVSKNIDVRFSIITDNTLGTMVYQELYSHITTSKYGVFSLIIGKGERTGGIYTDLSQVNWSHSLHYLKVEVKFENDFIEMGIMQFLSVPYALYAEKSLEAGPQGSKGDTGPQGLQGIQGLQGLKGDAGTQGLKGDTGPVGLQGVQGVKGDNGTLGPKGDAGVQGIQGVQGLKGDNGTQGPKGDAGVQGLQGVQGLKGDQGDPASDKQTLSLVGSDLSISIGNGGTPSTVNLSSINIPHSLTLLGDTLSISGGNKVGLPNQIQDLMLDVNNKLKITRNASATEYDLTKYLDNTDNQTLSFNSSDNKVSITGGNSVDLTPMKQDLLLSGNTLTITNTASPNAISLSKYLQSLTFNGTTNILTISDGGTADLTPMKQDLLLTGNNLTITNTASPTPISLSKYLQTLSFNSTTNILTISDGGTADLTALKNDADADPTNELQDLSLAGNEISLTKSSAKINLAPYLDNTDNQALSYNSSTNTLSLTNGGNVDLTKAIIAFRAKKTTSVSATAMSDVTFVPEAIPTADEYNDGNAFNRSSGEFIAPTTGIYCFNVSYTADGPGGSRKLSIYYKSVLYEDIAVEISTGTIIQTRSLTMKINSGEIVKLVINTGTSIQTGTGTFSGYRVY